MVMDACLQAGVHYVDMGGLFHTTREQLKLADRFASIGLIAILGIGSAPGIPNVHTRYAADRLDTIESIKIYDGCKTTPSGDLRFPHAVPTIIDELTVKPMVFAKGEFVPRERLSDFKGYMFSHSIGLRSVHLSLHSEVATLPVTFRN
jgi:saccharopine dehydrogenase-like NADP-dependent oxidoreductase